MENELLQRIFAMVGGGGASANQSPVPQQFFAGAQRPVGVPQISSPAPPSFNQPRIASPVPSGFNPPQPSRLAPPDVETPSAPPDNSDLVGRFRDMLGGDQAPAAAPQFSAGSFLGDAAAGMTVGRPSDPPGRAIAQGFAGAMESAKARQAEARKAASDAVRAQRDAEEFGWKREDRPLDRAEKAAEAKDKSLKTKLETAKMAIEIAKLNDPNMPLEDRLKLAKGLSDARQSYGDQAMMSDDQKKEIDAAINKLKLELVPATTGKGVAPQSAAPAAAPVKGADGIYTGVTTMEQATALGSGTPFHWRGKVKIVP